MPSYGVIFVHMKKGMRHLIHLLFAVLIAAALWQACRPAPPDEIPLPTKMCIRTSHHGQVIPHARVWVKYNADTFPGYDKPESYFDTSFETGADGRGCFEPVPEGKHWLVAFGYDSLHYPYHVFGSLRVFISIPYHETVDTTLWVSE